MGNVLALDTPTLLKLVKVPVSTLNSWVRREFCPGPLDAGTGRRATRYWTVEHVVTFQAIKALRAAGCPLQLIAKVDDQLRNSFNSNLAAATLCYDGRDVFVIEGSDVINVIRNAGQAAFPEALTLSAFPLRPWQEDGARNAKEVDIDQIRSRREKLKQRRAS